MVEEQSEEIYKRQHRSVRNLQACSQDPHGKEDRLIIIPKIIFAQEGPIC